MKAVREFVINAVVGGVLVLLPVYLAVLLLLQGMKMVGNVVHPIAAMLPDLGPGEDVLSLLVVLSACFVVGAAVRTRAGQVVLDRMEMTFSEDFPATLSFGA